MGRIGTRPVRGVELATADSGLFPQGRAVDAAALMGVGNSTGAHALLRSCRFGRLPVAAVALVEPGFRPSTRKFVPRADVENSLQASACRSKLRQGTPTIGRCHDGAATFLNIAFRISR
jgi:hypothetical protein